MQYQAHRRIELELRNRSTTCLGTQASENSSDVAEHMLIFSGARAASAVVCVPAGPVDLRRQLSQVWNILSQSWRRWAANGDESSYCSVSHIQHVTHGRTAIAFAAVDRFPSLALPEIPMTVPLLPAQPLDGAAQSTRVGRDPLAIPASVKADIRILVVDDDRTFREGCASVLELDGYNVTFCGRGDEALEIVRRRKFDIVLVDLYLQPISGIDILKATLETHKETIVVVMTGNPSVSSSIEALRAGARDYLP
jgi:CheY-like chemotaxis protein